MREETQIKKEYPHILLRRELNIVDVDSRTHSHGVQQTQGISCFSQIILIFQTPE